MSVRKIISKTVTQDFYVSVDGRETPVFDMEPVHLVNAFGVAVREDNDNVMGVLKKEILRRMTPDVL